MATVQSIEQILYYSFTDCDLEKKEVAIPILPPIKRTMKAMHSCNTSDRLKYH